MHWTFELLIGESAMSSLAVPELRSSWQRLAGLDTRCTWFQEPGFVLPWYSVYSEVYEPVVFLGRDKHGALVGFMPLARDRQSGQLAHAGANHAFYQGWISAPEIETSFVQRCAQSVFEEGANAIWKLTYLPPGTEVDLVAEATGLAYRVHTINTPVWSLVDKAGSKGHKTLRNYLNRYRRRGELELVRVSATEESERLLEDTTPWTDLRHGAIDGDLPFKDDPRKLKFYKALLASSAEHVAYAMRLDGQPIVVYLGAFDGCGRYLGLYFAADPTESRSAPSLVGLVELAKIVSEKAQEFDMIPGGEPWKERFATGHRDVHTLEFFRKSSHARREELTDAVRGQVKNVIRKVGKNPAEFKTQVKHLGKELGSMAGAFRQRRAREAPLIVEIAIDQHTPMAEVRSEPSPTELCSWLLRFDDEHTRDESREFFARASRCLYEGWSPLLAIEAERLALVAWLQPDKARVELPQNGTVNEPRIVSPQAKDFLEQAAVPPDVSFLWIDYIGRSVQQPNLEKLVGQAAAMAHDLAKNRVWVMVAFAAPHASEWLRGFGNQLAATSLFVGSSRR